MTEAELARRVRERAYLEGDFVLRSGRRSRYYLDKYRFETDPELLGELGKRLAAAAVEPARPDRLAGPELGAVALAASASLASGLPFLIVRKSTKEYGTENLVEGVWEVGETVCLVEDVVTSGGAAVAAVRALREAGLECLRAVCVVDREEGGVEALTAEGVVLVSLFRAADVLRS
ncbi:MAG TPA: orotate phosphoribosyltransferase [Gaiellaceae bacterium]|nr:orotate phosphoribosyltransferase [Gaiellaceae bacterium]